MRAGLMAELRYLIRSAEIALGAAGRHITNEVARERTERGETDKIMRAMRKERAAKKRRAR